MQKTHGFSTEWVSQISSCSLRSHSAAVVHTSLAQQLHELKIFVIKNRFHSDILSQFHPMWTSTQQFGLKIFPCTLIVFIINNEFKQLGKLPVDVL